jgi:hypothetical protein
MIRIPSAWRRLIGAALFVALPALAADQVTVERDTALYAEPRVESQQVAQLEQGTTGEVVGKNGAWLNIKTQAATGWLFSFNVRFASQQSGDGGSALGRVFAPRRSTPMVTSTIGIRGLDETDLRQATFNTDQMRLLDEYAASRDAAQGQARDAGLTPARVDYLGGKPQ